MTMDNVNIYLYMEYKNILSEILKFDILVAIIIIFFCCYITVSQTKLQKKKCNKP